MDVLVARRSLLPPENVGRWPTVALHGQHQDLATGLHKMVARYYQPELGRWTQPDPLRRVVTAAQPPEANAYLYVGANPINFIDPSGLLSKCAVGAIALTAVSAALTVASAGAGAPAAFGPQYAAASIGLTVACEFG
jgi:RHS repeat-associated protein